MVFSESHNEFIAVLKEFSAILCIYKGKYRVLTIQEKQRNFLLKVKWNSNFLESPFIYCRIPSEVVLFFRSERQKFPYHLLNFSVSSLSSAENNYGKSNCKWQAPFLSVGLLISEKPLPVFNRHPHRFILTNGKHP